MYIYIYTYTHSIITSCSDVNSSTMSWTQPGVFEIMKRLDSNSDRTAHASDAQPLTWCVCVCVCVCVCMMVVILEFNIHLKKPQPKTQSFKNYIHQKHSALLLSRKNMVCVLPPSRKLVTETCPE